MYVKEEKIYHAYVSKHNSNCEKQVILLMVSNREKLWHYLAVKKLSALLRGITYKHHGYFYSLNCLHSFVTTKKLKLHKKVYGNKDFCNVIMVFEDIKVLEFNQYQKSEKHDLLFMQILSVECPTDCNFW